MSATTSVSRQDPITLLTPPPTPIVPAVGPVQAPLINGVDALGAQSATGLTPTISWSAPLVGVPTSYSVTIHRLHLAPDLTTSTATPIASWTLAGTRIDVPPGVLQGGERYFVQIVAYANGSDTYATAPYRTSNLSSHATTLTAPFTP
jgi:hypothetical protein